MILYFSATGNSKYVAERIAREFDENAVSMEKPDGIIELAGEEMFGIVSAVHWWELPVYVREFLQKMTFKGNSPPLLRHTARHRVAPLRMPEEFSGPKASHSTRVSA